MKRLLMASFIALMGITLVSTNAWAQGTAEISGTVTDPTGALIPGAEINVTQTNTGITRNTVTNETGSYALPALPVGPYRLEAVLPGFQTYVQTGIVLQVGSAPVINVRLEIGQVTQTVEVQANAALVETRTTAVGSVIENERILELPLNGRNVTDLITLSGGAVQTGTSGGAGGFQGDATVRISVAGGLDFGVSYSLDGAMHIDMYNGANHPMPFPDALQEFKIENAGMSSSSSGMRSGGAVNAVTKSGTNEFHGSLFEFVRNYKFNARNFFAAERDTLKRNQFGGTIGGPISQNRLFFFFGAQMTKTRSDPSTEISFVPTPAMMAGDFTAVAGPNCNDLTLGGPFVNNQVSTALFSPAAVALAQRLPAAQNECGEIRWGAIEKINEDQYVGRVDWQQNPDHTIFGRYVATTYELPAPRGFQDNVLTSTTHGRDNLAQSYSLGSTYLFSPTTINSFRLTVNRTSNFRYHAPNFSVEDLGVDSYTEWGTASGRPRIDVEVDGAFDLGGNSYGTFNTTAYQLTEDVSLVRGNHQIAFGGTVAHWRTNQYAATRAVGQYAFGDSLTGLGLADFLLGRLELMEHGSDTLWGSRNDYLSVHASDVWRVTPNVTLNYGVRWEPFFSIEQSTGTPYNFSKDRFDQGIRSTAVPTAPVGFYYPGDTGFPESGGPMNHKWWLFNPRVGFAWDVFGDGRTSIRGSGGIASDFTVSALFGGGASAPPWAFRTEVESPSGGFDNPWSDWVGPRPVPYPWGAGVFTPFAIFAGFQGYDLAPPTVQQWNLSVQQQIGNDWIASTSYIGSHTIHIWALQAQNNGVYFPGQADANGQCFTQGLTLSGLNPGQTCSSTNNTNDRRRLNLENPAEGQFMGVVNNREDGGTGSYHGLILSLQRRASSGVNVGANYTWSHCISYANTFATNESGEYVDPNNRELDRGNCDSDRRHVFNLTSVVSTPELANPTARMIASGWSLSTVLRISSGEWLTLQNRRDRALIGDSRRGVQRPEQLLDDPYLDRDGFEYINPDAFNRNVPLGTISDVRTNNIEGPGTWGLDVALRRAFNITESTQLTIRADAFNVTNSLRRGNPRVNMGSRFGEIESARDGRIMQFSAKFIF